MSETSSVADGASSYGKDPAPASGSTPGGASVASGDPGAPADGITDRDDEGAEEVEGPPPAGPRRLLIALYAIFALAATARAVVQLTTQFEQAPLAYVLSAFCGVVYLAATVGLVSRRSWSRPLAWAACGTEMAGVLVVAYYLVPRGAWDVSETAPGRPLLLLPWAAGFVAYQLTLPTFFTGVGAGWTSWWTARQADLGIPATNGLSASLVSLTVATVLTALVAVPPALRARR